MEQKAGAQISQRAFIQSLAILFVLMMIAGILTRVVPAGQYTRIEVDGRETIDPNSFRFTERPDYPVWRWFIKPIEVLGSESGLTIIVIIVVLFFAGGFEFGTFGDSLPALIRSLRFTIPGNQLRQFGAKSETIARAVRKEYKELFFSAESHWREKALADGRQALKGILKAYRLLGD